jgi:hypothetical protein
VDTPCHTDLFPPEAGSHKSSLHCRTSATSDGQHLPDAMDNPHHSNFSSMGVWQGVAMDSLKFRPSTPCPTLLRPKCGPPLKRLYGCYRGDPPPGRAACGRPLPPWTPHAVRLRFPGQRRRKVKRPCLARIRIRRCNRLSLFLGRIPVEHSGTKSINFGINSKT